MATISYTGAAPLVAQVNRVTPGGTIAATDDFYVFINGKSITFPATGSTVAHVVAGLKAAYDLCAEPEFLEVEATDMTTYLKLEARTPGKSFTQTSLAVNTSGGAAPTLVTSTEIDNSGPDQYDLTANWSGTPTTGDTGIVEGSHNLRYGDLSAVTFARLMFRDFNGEVGLRPTNLDGDYPEYRQQKMLISATVIDVMPGCSSPLIRLNVGTVQTLCTVYSMGTPAVPTIPAFSIQGTHASNVFNFMCGGCGTATEAGETATASTVRIGESQGSGGSDIELGEGLSLTTLTADGGSFRIYCDVATVTCNKGNSTLIDDPDITTQLKVKSDATCTINGGPTLTKLVLIGTLDLSKDVRPVTVTNCDLYSGATIIDPYGRLTFTNPIVRKECDFKDLTLSLPQAVSFA